MSPILSRTAASRVRTRLQPKMVKQTSLRTLMDEDLGGQARKGTQNKFFGHAAVLPEFITKFDPANQPISFETVFVP
jgi:hypothetical protein